jgi:transaldolase
MSNPLRELASHGQSAWYDGLRRPLITRGDLTRLIEEDGLAGLTTNPSIYEKAIAETDDYDESLSRLFAGPGLAAQSIFESLAVEDLRAAADHLRPVYERTGRRDGYVSFEVPPSIARDTAGTVREATRLWKLFDRPNVMIKVPGTPEAVPAVQALLAEGVNVNITLLFARGAYAAVAEAYVAALEERLDEGEDISRVASVASFFVSRIDTMVDDLLAKKAKGAAPDERARVEALSGKVAIANAKLAYQHYLALVASPRWERLADHGAMPQRLLWASTSTKNPRYRDVMYVEELVGPSTIDTMPPATFDAFRDHGRVRLSLLEAVDAARSTLDDLERSGISLDEVTERLLEEGLRLFAEPFEKLMSMIERRRGEAEHAAPPGH